MTITLTVAGRIATVDATTHVVAGNTYPVTLSLDSEWTGSLYLRVRFGSLYYDIPFASSAASVDVQMPVGYPEVGIGVFSEALEICTCEARVRLLRSILEAGEQVVEFDSDLYDQWAGEVTTLLTDDAFDAESTRPVQNAVLTAWKDTVPLDSALVHKTGNETIGGVKTFSEHLNLSKNLNQNSTQGYLEAGNKFQVACYDQKDNASNLFSLSYGAYNAGGAFNSMGTRLYKPDRSGYFAWDTRAYADHMLMMTLPYYPVDGQGNPQALTANALVASGNIAVDPRLVHTSGIETIAGEKTLLTAPVVSASESGIIFLSDRSESSNQRITTLKFADATNPRNDPLSQFAVGRTAQYNYAISYLKKGTTSHSVTFRAHADHMDVAVTPYYPVDSGGNPQALTANALVASGNLAVDPRIVHTTGNETVAGTKTFTNGVDAYPQNWHPTAKTGMSVGQYVIFAEITALNSVGRFVAVDFIQSSNTASCMGRMLFRCKIDASENPLAVWVYRKSKGSNDPLSAHSIVVLYKDGHAYLAWKREAPYGAVVARIAQDMGYGSVQSSTSSAVRFIPSADMTVLNNLDGYTVYEVTE